MCAAETGRECDAIYLDSCGLSALHISQSSSCQLGPTRVSCVSAVATLHLMCGLPGVGKTTRARELERQYRAIRLTPDEWITASLGADPSCEALHAARDPTELQQWRLAARLLALGIDVILDFGFWSRTEREDYRDRAAAIGAGSEVHFIEATPDVLRDRLAHRRVARPVDTFLVTDEQLDEWSGLFEVPTAAELVPRPAPNS